MASGAQHYRKAEALLAEAAEIDSEDFETYTEFLMAKQVTALVAQVHATQGLAAAAALTGLADMNTNRAGDEWARATLPSTAGA